jgi:succinoglycan biosynthesis transport protein ExoP
MEIEEFLTYWRVIKRRWWLILLLVIATAGVILYTSLTAAPVYSATVKLQVIGSEPQQVSIFSTVRSTSTGDDVAAVQSEFVSILENGVVAWRTIASLNLSMGAVELLNRVSATRDGDAIYVTVQADTPQQAEAIVNAHVDNALAYYREYRALPARVTRQFLSQLVSDEGEKLAAAQDALLKFKLKNNVESLEKEMSAYQDIVRNLKSQRDASQVEELRARAAAAAYRAEAAKVQADLDKLPPTEGSSTAAYYKETIQRHLVSAAEQDAIAEGHKTAREEYDRLITQKEGELLTLLGLSKEYDSLQRAVAQVEGSYNFLQSKENEAKLKETTALGVGYIQVVEKARTPDAPAQSNLARLLALGVIASLAAGVILAFIIEFFESLGRTMVSQERGK